MKKTTNMYTSSVQILVWPMDNENFRSVEFCMY